MFSLDTSHIYTPAPLPAIPSSVLEMSFKVLFTGNQQPNQCVQCPYSWNLSSDRRCQMYTRNYPSECKCVYPKSCAFRDHLSFTLVWKALWIGSSSGSFLKHFLKLVLLNCSRRSREEEYMCQLCLEVVTSACLGFIQRTSLYRHSTQRHNSLQWQFDCLRMRRLIWGFASRASHCLNLLDPAQMVIIHINPCHAEYIKIPRIVLIVSQSDYLI